MNINSIIQASQTLSKDGKADLLRAVEALEVAQRRLDIAQREASRAWEKVEAVLQASYTCLQPIEKNVVQGLDEPLIDAYI